MSNFLSKANIYSFYWALIGGVVIFILGIIYNCGAVHRRLKLLIKII
jgi:hypothetical protein